MQSMEIKLLEKKAEIDYVFCLVTVSTLKVVSMIKIILDQICPLNNLKHCILAELFALQAETYRIACSVLTIFRQET